MSLAQVKDLSIDVFRAFTDQRGTLIPVEMLRFVPFKPVRLFWVTDVPVGTKRGEHGHKLCSQYFICLHGQVLVEASDGRSSLILRLDQGHGLYVPPLIFVTETYVSRETMLLVICDRPFEENDYIDTRDELVRLREVSEKL